MRRGSTTRESGVAVPSAATDLWRIVGGRMVLFPTLRLGHGGRLGTLVQSFLSRALLD